jgi:hypothetical protein
LFKNINKRIVLIIVTIFARIGTYYKTIVPKVKIYSVIVIFREVGVFHILSSGFIKKQKNILMRWSLDVRGRNRNEKIVGTEISFYIPG